METFRAPVWGVSVQWRVRTAVYSGSFLHEFHYPKLVLYTAWLESPRNCSWFTWLGAHCWFRCPTNKVPLPPSVGDPPSLGSLHLWWSFWKVWCPMWLTHPMWGSNVSRSSCQGQLWYPRLSSLCCRWWGLMPEEPLVPLCLWGNCGGPASGAGDACTFADLITPARRLALLGVQWWYSWAWVPPHDGVLQTCLAEALRSGEIPDSVLS